MARIELVKVGKTLQEPVSGMFPKIFRSRPGDGSALRKTFSINSLDVCVPDGATLVVLGPSGCGKTTLLRIIAGLIQPDCGEILYDGRDVRDVPPGERRIGMLFQNYALYPHLDVKTNILSYFFFRKKTPELNAEKQARYARTSEVLGVEIRHLLGRMPPGLSGGEKQRVALGRCITRDPALFLLDEPFSNLDPKLRETYRVNLKTLLRQFKITTVYVTHDQQEAMILADLVAIMNEGRLEQVGAYEELYAAPGNVFVADFLKLDPLLPSINFIGGEKISPAFAQALVGIRPEDLVVVGNNEEGRMRGIITSRTDLPLRNMAVLGIRSGGYELAASVPVGQTASPGAEVRLGFAKYHLFDRSTGARLETRSA